jgi:hypothetical protein
LIINGTGALKKGCLESISSDFIRSSAREGEEPMPHKFKVGDIVAIRPTISRFVQVVFSK